MLAFILILAGLIVLFGIVLTLCFFRSCPDCDKDLLDWEYSIYMGRKRSVRDAD